MTAKERKELEADYALERLRAEFWVNDPYADRYWATQPEGSREQAMKRVAFYSGQREFDMVHPNAVVVEIKAAVPPNGSNSDVPPNGSKGIIDTPGIGAVTKRGPLTPQDIYDAVAAIDKISSEQ